MHYMAKASAVSVVSDDGRVVCSSVVVRRRRNAVYVIGNVVVGGGDLFAIDLISARDLCRFMLPPHRYGHHLPV